MKRNTLPLLAVMASLALQTGCTQTKVSTAGFTLTRSSFLQKLEFADVEFSTNGTARLKGYKTDGGNEAAAALIGAAVSAAVAAAKP